MSEASKHALKRGMTPTHELMVDWILQNPGGTLKQMGDYFGYSASWLCTVMKSDAFKSYAAERLADVHNLVSQGIPARMEALAVLAIERMEETLVKTEDSDTIKDSFDKVMHRYGYAPNAQRNNPMQPGGFQQNNIFYLSPEQHAAVREKLINNHSNPPNPPLPAIPAPQPVTTVESDEPEKISSS